MSRIARKDFSRELSAIATIAYRDWTKLLRDRSRLVASFIFPILFIGVLGKSFDAAIGEGTGINFLALIFTGVFAQSLFQSSAAGVVSLIDDRASDFSQELFVAPVSRYSIIFGKILGETLVSYTAGIGVILFGLLVGVTFTGGQFLLVFMAGLAACLLGASFGVLVLSNMTTQQSAVQVFQFILFPQIFLAGVFNPIDKLPLVLTILSRAMPLTYAVDLVRNAYYGAGSGAGAAAFSPLVNLTVISVLFSVFLVFGTILFIRRERRR